MGNTMSCFDRWGKRTPDGALFTVKKSGGSDFTKASSAFNGPAGASTSTAASASGAGGVTKSNATSARAERSSRRRQTYSSNASKNAESEVSSYDEGDDFDESDEDEELTTKDVRQQKLLDYRRKLTKIGNPQHKEVRSLCCCCSSAVGDVFAVAVFPQITSVKSQADNPKGLTITVNNPGPTTYSFTFKTKEERVTWQEQLESFQKFMSMR
ncbi:hypothetical protein ACSSS7_006147 [Eimeria intestinalis]